VLSVLKRPLKFDLRGRLDGPTPGLLSQMGVATALLAAVGVGRAIIEAMAPGVAPFALLYPAVLAATLIAGWACGLMVTTTGGVVAWFFLLDRLVAPPARTLADIVSLALYFVASGAIIAFAEAFRRGARMRLADQAALEESEARLELATAAASVGVWEWRPLSNEMIYSDEAKAICGFPLNEPVTYDMVAAVTHPEDFPWTSAQAARALNPAIRDENTYEYRLLLPSGEVRWVVANGRAVFETVGGVPMATRYVGTLQDITDRKQAEVARNEAAKRLSLAIDAGRMAVWQVDAQRGVTPSPELNRMLGFPEDASPTLRELAALNLPGEMGRVREIAQGALARGERFFEAEYRMRRTDGEMRWFLVRAELILDAPGVSRGAIGVAMDITERKDSEERLKLLAREVDHRANNLLTVVLGTVQLSQAPTMEALKAVLVGRIAALGRAHQLLSEARWEGADLRRLVEEELLAFSLGEAARVSIDGPDVALSPAAAQGLAMALHELATNAVKYGALSAPLGRVAVTWARQTLGGLSIRWAESNGPEVAAPSRRGLGTAMLARALSGPLGGASKLDWRREGLVCELELPDAALEATLHLVSTAPSVQRSHGAAPGLDPGDGASGGEASKP
jgi:PAS domain S-box-containing protein